MPDIRMIQSVVKEYGSTWLVNRTLYSAKLKMMRTVPITERLFEKEADSPHRLDIFDIDVKYLTSYLKENLLGNNKKQLIEKADKACDGIIMGFSSIELNYGNPIDWQLNPLTGMRCNEKQKWYMIPDFDKELGDIKAIWEISRFSHFISLARAYLLTESPKYYQAFRNQLSDWLADNKYSYGANFKCGQECSLRMINALLAYKIFYSYRVTDLVDEGNMKCLVERCYKKILSNFSYAYKCIKNNHTISELMGMIVGAWCCGDEKQMLRAYKMLDEVIDEQFTDDGGYRQFSFNYQRLALQDLEVVLCISKSTGLRLSDRSLEKIKKAAILMYQCQDESGDMPNYGSNDGALIFPVTSCDYRDFRSVINAAYALSSGMQLYAKGIYQEELIWFGKGKTLDEYPIVRIKRFSNQFIESGLFTIRKPIFWTMIVANEYKTRPAHMDQFHIDLWAYGVNIFCDAGTYSYASEMGQELVNNSSHNTVVVKGILQMNKIGPFMIYGWTSRKLGDTKDEYFEGEVRSVNGYKHERRIEVKKSSLIITDIVDKDAFILFHTPCDVEVDGSNVVLLVNGQVIAIISCDYDVEIKESVRSLYYLKGEKTNCIAIKAKANEKVRTLINIEESMEND